MEVMNPMWVVEYSVGVEEIYDVVWYGTVWCGVVWYGMVLYGVWYGIWYGVVWYDMTDMRPNLTVMKTKI